MNGSSKTYRDVQCYRNAQLHCFLPIIVPGRPSLVATVRSAALASSALILGFPHWDLPGPKFTHNTICARAYGSGSPHRQCSNSQSRHSGNEVTCLFFAFTSNPTHSSSHEHQTSRSRNYPGAYSANMTIA